MSTTTTAYGSITIVDITDVGEFSVQPMSNSPLSVIYDPNNSTYNPNWSTNNVELTPIIYYAGKQITSEVNVEWQYQYGIGGLSEITETNTQHEISNNKLKIKSNMFAVTGASDLLTYICKATYNEPTFTHCP